MTGNRSILVSAAFFIIILVSCKENRQSPEFKESYLEEKAENRDVIPTIGAQDELSSFYEALQESIEIPIQGETFTSTVFAPNNDAFSLNGNSGTRDIPISDLVKYHIIGEEIQLNDLKNRIQSTEGPLHLVTLSGKELQATLEGDKVALKDQSGNTAHIVRSIDAINGMVHIIDNTLIPEQRQEN